MQDEGRVAILIIRAHLAEVTPGDPGRPWARVTWLTDLDAPATEVVRPAGSRAGVHRLVEEWLDVIGIPATAPDDGAGAGPPP